MTRRPHGTGSVSQEHGARHGCPPVEVVIGKDGKPVKVRPEHKCRGPWVGSYESGWSTTGVRARKRVKAATEKECRVRLLAAMRQGETAAPVVGARPTVHSWCATWLENTSTHLRPKTWGTNRSAVRQWIDPTIGKRRLDTLSPGDVRAVYRAVLDAGRKPATATRAHAVLMWLLKDAIREGHKVPPAVLLVDGPGAGETDRDAIPLDDALEILAIAATRPDASRWLAAMLGMRPSECRGLTWRAVDFERSRIDVSWQLMALPYKVARDRSSGFRIPPEYSVRQVHGAIHLVRPKTDSGKRIIPMVPAMKAALLAWKAIAPTSTVGLVWPDAQGMPRDDGDDRDAWRSITDEAQVARVDEDNHGRRYALYECRHTAAVLLRANGATDEDITAILGHASILSSRAYLHATSISTREALERVMDRLELTAGDAPALASAAEA